MSELHENPGPALTLIVPAYNEAERLPATLARLREYLGTHHPDHEILVVDDGSSDDTAARAEAVAEGDPRVRVLRYTPNRGKGYAVRFGAGQARGAWVLFSDADLSTPIEELEHLSPYLGEGYDVVIGSRAIEGANLARRQPWLREKIGRTFNLLVRMLGVQGIRDSQCGFKLFTRQAAGDIFPALTIDRWAFDVEALVVADKLGYRIKEVPVTWLNAPGSKVHVIRDSVRTVSDLVRIRLTWMRRTPQRNSANSPSSVARPDAP